MGFPSMLSFSNSPILSIKHNISRAWDRCSCPAVISYASVPCKHMLQTQGQNSTVLGKAGAHCVGNVAGSLASPAFHWGSETSCYGQQRDKKKNKKSSFHFRDTNFLHRQNRWQIQGKRTRKPVSARAARASGLQWILIDMDWWKT